MSLALRCIWLLALLLVAGHAAGAGVTLDTQASTRQVELGGSFHVQLTALVEAGQDVPDSPRLRLPPGFVAQGPSVSTQQQVTIVGGRIQQRQGMTATWVVTAQRVGSVDIGPASVSLGGKRIEGQRMRIEVLPKGQAPRAPSSGRFPFDPFDPFSGRGLFPSLPGFDDPQADDGRPAVDELPAFPEELRVERAPDETAFLRAVATPERAVVGEQITLRVYAYGRRGPFREVNSTEPSRADFVAYPIVENSYGEQRHRVPIEGDVWYAVKIREIALFPIRAGALTIGSMRMGFEGRAYPSASAGLGLVRESPAVQVTVSEPPVSGRPPGYRIGDVGRYQLTAEVRPREVKAGEAVAVEIKLEGTGNVPYQLSTPQQRGVEWLEPTVYDKVEPQGSVVGGFRKLSYVVRVERPGRIELGDVTLPYWDPSERRYAVARAPLGAVEVSPAASDRAEPAPAPHTDRLAGIVTPRVRLGSRAERPWYLADRPAFWWLLALGPLGVVAAGLGVRIGRSVRRELSAKRQSSTTQIGRALEEARRSLELADADALGKAASAAERAVVLAIEGAVGLKARAVVRDKLPAELETRGLSAGLAADIRDLLDELDTLRFTGNGAAGAHPASLVERTSDVVSRLARARQRSASEATA